MIFVYKRGSPEMFGTECAFMCRRAVLQVNVESHL